METDRYHRKLKKKVEFIKNLMNECNLELEVIQNIRCKHSEIVDKVCLVCGKIIES